MPYLGPPRISSSCPLLWRRRPFTIRLAHQLGMTVVAEGVEDAASAAALRELGCNQAQGFFYTRPLPPEDFEALWRGWVPTPG